MKTAPAKRLIKSWAIALLIFSCTPPEGRDFKEGQAQASRQNFSQSLVYFERAAKRTPQSLWAMRAAREGARVAYLELKDYKKAADFYHHLVMHSDDNAERIDSQRRLGEIYLDNLQDYPKAIVEFSRLIEQKLSDQEIGHYRLGLARAYYYQNNLFQAESEISEALKLKIEPPLRFNATMLKGNIFIARKQYSQAADLFNELIELYPEKSKQENVPMTLAVCYEEAGDFKSALSILETLRDNYNPPEYIDLRIKRLKERQKNQPGAKGFRK